MAKGFHCSIVTPTETVFDEEVAYASFPAWDGQQGVMAGQSPLLTRLGFGSLRLDFAEGGSRWYLLEGGFAEVMNERLSLLTERATPAEKLSVEEAQAELAEARARVTAEARIEPGWSATSNGPWPSPPSPKPPPPAGGQFDRP